MQNCTQTLDEQDKLNPYKPFPKHEYFQAIHDAWQQEPILLIEKSRTMMMSWMSAAEILHECMTTPATRWIVVAQDEDRSLKILNYCWVLYEHQEQQFKNLWPLDRPREKQSYNVLELKHDSSIMALPGKDAANKIRSEHPTGIVFDEAAFIENFHGAMNSAISTRAKRIRAVTSAQPGDFREITREAVEIEGWPACVA